MSFEHGTREKKYLERRVIDLKKEKVFSAEKRGGASIKVCLCSNRILFCVSHVFFSIVIVDRRFFF